MQRKTIAPPGFPPPCRLEPITDADQQKDAVAQPSPFTHRHTYRSPGRGFLAPPPRPLPKHTLPRMSGIPKSSKSSNHLLQGWLSFSLSQQRKEAQKEIKAPSLAVTGRRQRRTQRGIKGRSPERSGGGERRGPRPRHETEEEADVSAWLPLAGCFQMGCLAWDRCTLLMCSLWGRLS